MTNRLKEVREKKRMSQDELSQKADVSRTIISMIENSSAKVVKTDTLIKIADALGEKVTTIFFCD